MRRSCGPWLPRFATGLWLLVALLVVGSFAAACGGRDAATPTTPNPPAPASPPPEPPAAPTGLGVSATGLDFIEWSWVPVEGVSGYDVQFSVDEAFAAGDEVIARTAEETSYRREDLEPGTSYFLRVRSAAGTGAGRITSEWSAPGEGTLLLARITSDRPDDFSGPQIHVVYAVASDGEDFELDTSGKILEMLGNIQIFLAERIDQVFRIDTFEGIPDITFVRLSGWNEDELIDLGVPHPSLERAIPVVRPERLRLALDEEIDTHREKHYAVFYTFDWGLDYITGSAGVKDRLAGTFMSSTELARFDMFPQLQQIYEVTTIHEIFHLFGAVASCAPNNGRGAHVVDHDLDIMSNSSVPQWEWTYIDFGRDDYYGHGRSDCVDISTSPYFEPAF